MDSSVPDSPFLQNLFGNDPEDSCSSSHYLSPSTQPLPDNLSQLSSSQNSNGSLSQTREAATPPSLSSSSPSLSVSSSFLPSFSSSSSSSFSPAPSSSPRSISVGSQLFPAASPTHTGVPLFVTNLQLLEQVTAGARIANSVGAVSHSNPSPQPQPQPHSQPQFSQRPASSSSSPFSSHPPHTSSPFSPRPVPLAPRFPIPPPGSFVVPRPGFSPHHPASPHSRPPLPSSSSSSFSSTPTQHQNYQSPSPSHQQQQQQRIPPPQTHPYPYPHHHHLSQQHPPPSHLHNPPPPQGSVGGGPPPNQQKDLGGSGGKGGVRDEGKGKELAVGDDLDPVMDENLEDIFGQTGAEDADGEDDGDDETVVRISKKEWKQLELKVSALNQQNVNILKLLEETAQKYFLLPASYESCDVLQRVRTIVDRIVVELKAYRECLQKKNVAGTDFKLVEQHDGISYSFHQTNHRSVEVRAPVDPKMSAEAKGKTLQRIIESFGIIQERLDQQVIQKHQLPFPALPVTASSSLVTSVPERKRKKRESSERGGKKGKNGKGKGDKKKKKKVDKPKKRKKSQETKNRKDKNSQADFDSDSDQLLSTKLRKSSIKVRRTSSKEKDKAKEKEEKEEKGQDSKTLKDVAAPKVGSNSQPALAESNLTICVPSHPFLSSSSVSSSSVSSSSSSVSSNSSISSVSLSSDSSSSLPFEFPLSPSFLDDLGRNGNITSLDQEKAKTVLHSSESGLPLSLSLPLLPPPPKVDLGGSGGGNEEKG